MMIWILALICLAVAAVIFFALQLRSKADGKTPSPPAYVCPNCGDQDCHCHRTDA